MADSKLTALSEISVPALEDLLYLVDDPSGTPASVKVTLARLLGFPQRVIADGRLTTESGVAISTADRSAQSTIYYTPYTGTRVALYDGTRWRLYTFAEVSLALSSLTSGKNYDVFLYDNSGTLTLELSAAWTNDTTRADALTTQDGITVKSGATTRRWLGTIRTTGTTTTEDTLIKRFVWNAQNMAPRKLLRDFGSSSHAYDSATIRQYNNDATAQVEVVVGVAGLSTVFAVNGLLTTTAANATRLGIGENVTNAFSVGGLVDLQIIGTCRVATTVPFALPLGYSVYTLLQQSNATGTHTYDFSRVMGHHTC